MVRFADGLRDLMVPIDSVHQHPDNPRNGDLDKIVESIQVNGFFAPIVVQRSTRDILVGNHRWQALHALDETQVPVIWMDVDNETALRVLIADNATSDAAQNDLAQLTALLNQLQETETGLVGTAIDETEYERLLLELAAEPPPQGGGPGMAPNGVYQVVVEFDNGADRDTLAAELHERFEEQVREVDL